MGCGSSSYDNTNHIRTITIVGLENSGKSNITFHLVATNATNYIPLPTAGVDFHELQLTSSTFHIFDCGGMSRYRSQWPYYIQKSDGVVFVIDRTDNERMGRVQEELGEVLNLCEKLEIPLLIFINKADITTNLTKDDFLKITKVQNFDVSYDIKNCSAKTGDGIIEGRDWLLQNIRPKDARPVSVASKASSKTKSVHNTNSKKDINNIISGDNKSSKSKSHSSEIKDVDKDKRQNSNAVSNSSGSHNEDSN